MFRLNPCVNPQVQNTDICIINIVFLAIFYFKRTLRISDPCLRSFLFIWLKTNIPEKVKVKDAQLCLTLWDLMDYAVHGIIQARIQESVTFPSPRDLPNPAIEARSPTLQVDSLPAEPQGKSKKTGVGSLSLLQWIFPIPGVEPGSLALQMVSLPTELWGKPIYLRTCWHSWLCSTHSPHPLQPHQNKT